MDILRIHFALRSISLEKTTIDYYDSEIIENQLGQITHNFIQSETEFDSKLKLIRTSKFLFSYYRDFGGMRSVKKTIANKFKKRLERVYTSVQKTLQNKKQYLMQRNCRSSSN